MDADVLQRPPVGRLKVRYFILALLLVAAHVHAADCPPVLDAAIASLSDDKPESIYQYRG